MIARLAIGERVMNKYITILLLAFSGSVYAESYLCIAEAAGGVRAGFKHENMEAHVYTTDTKWIVENESGNWVVTEFGNPSPSFDVCEHDIIMSTIRCGDHAGQVFYYHINSSVYDTYMIRFSSTSIDQIVERGRCSKI
jgi:hypothetical protein